MNITVLCVVLCIAIGFLGGILITTIFYEREYNNVIEYVFNFKDGSGEDS